MRHASQSKNTWTRSRAGEASACAACFPYLQDLLVITRHFSNVKDLEGGVRLASRQKKEVAFSSRIGGGTRGGRPDGFSPAMYLGWAAWTSLPRQIYWQIFLKNSVHMTLGWLKTAKELANALAYGIILEDLGDDLARMPVSRRHSDRSAQKWARERGDGVGCVGVVSRLCPF